MEWGLEKTVSAINNKRATKPTLKIGDLVQAMGDFSVGLLVDEKEDTFTVQWINAPMKMKWSYAYPKDRILMYIKDNAWTYYAA